MRFTLEAKDLVAALRKTKGATEKRNYMPILACVVIDAHADTVTYAATDLEVSVEIVDPLALVQTEGSAVLPLDKLLKLARKLKGAVSFESAKDDAVVIRCEERGSTTTLQGSARDEFPTLPGEFSADQSEIDAVTFGSALAAVLHAASKDESQYNLNGVCVDADTYETPRAVATDGQRLAIADMKSLSLPWTGGIIIPLKGVKLLVGLMKGEEAVRVATDPAPFKSLRIAGDTWTLTVRLIEGEFPNYEQVIPKTIGETVTVDRDEFAAALDTASELAAERTMTVKLVINSGIDLCTNNPDLGDSVVKCSCDRAGTEEIEVGFNVKYLADAIKAVCDGRVTLEFADYKWAPVRISGSEPTPFAIVMPMRL